MDKERLLDWADALEGLASEVRMSVAADDAVEAVLSDDIVMTDNTIISDAVLEAVKPRAHFNIQVGSDMQAWRRTIENQFGRGGGGPVQIDWGNGRVVICNTMSEVDNELGA